MTMPRFAMAMAICLCLSRSATGDNLLVNGSFGSNTAGWSFNPAISAVAWAPLDVLDRPSSGSMSLTINKAPGSGSFVWQCAAVTPGAAYDAGAKIMLTGAQPKAKAALSVLFYESSNCAGQQLASGMFPPWVTTPSNGAFIPIAQRGFIADQKAHSAWVLLTVANVEAGTVTAHFDDVIFAPAGGCIPDESTLCLQGGRFEVTATYAAPGAAASAAHTVQLTEDSGYMWFFGPDNIEVTLKVLDGCGTNQHQWVFAAGMTNVEVNLTVLDTQTRLSRHYTNPMNVPFEAILDTGAFSCP